MRRRMLLSSALCLTLAGCGVRRVESGLVPFQNYCAACHQYDGQGMGDAPPLDHSPWVTGPEERLIKLVLHGVRGPMEVAGKNYDLEMPGFGPVLSDSEAASLLSFVRRRFGGIKEPVRPGAVARVRAEHRGRTTYWDVEQLLQER
jgi:mono/diheme cytochrome c family protein